jgi:hypothetical protein
MEKLNQTIGYLRFGSAFCAATAVFAYNQRHPIMACFLVFMSIIATGPKK